MTDRTSGRNSTSKAIDDLIGPAVKLLLVGVNPGLRTAAMRIHFAHPSNRFYLVLHLAGLTDYRITPTPETTASDRAHLVDRGIGITNLVERPTRRSSEIPRSELRAGITPLMELTKRHRPNVVAITGITAYRAAFAQPKAQFGRQDTPFEQAELWALPNTSGLNSRRPVDEMARWYESAGRAAGILT